MRMIKKITCAIRGHEYKPHQFFSAWSCRVRCTRCGGSWALNVSERIILPWSSEFEQFYTEHGHAIHPLPTEATC